MVPEPAQRIDRFERMAYGLFIHWGLYSQLGRGEWVQYHEEIPTEEYKQLADTFTASEFDPRRIARLAADSGMNYIVFTTRHHDGFSLYDTRGLSEFDAPHSAAGRDLVAEFVDACRTEGIVPFFYHTTLDWHVGTNDLDSAAFDDYLDYLHDSVELLCTEYGDVGGFWFDGNWSRDDVDWKVDRLYSIIREHQPETIIIDNTGMSARGEVGHPEIDSVTFEQGNPKPIDHNDRSKYVTGEVCQTMNRHWGYTEKDFGYLSPADIIENLATARGMGMNYLLNVGPTEEGAIPSYEAAAFRRAGEWIDLYSDVVYDGTPVDCDCRESDFVLEANGSLYYLAFDLGIRGAEDVVADAADVDTRTIGQLSDEIERARWIDNGEPLEVTYNPSENELKFDCTPYPYGTYTVVRVAELTPK